MSAFIPAAKVSQVPEGGLFAVRVGDEDVVLYNVKGTIFASRDFCPHAGYPLSKSFFRGKYVKCALHNWEFDVTTGRLTENPAIGMRCYAVKVEGDDVLVSLTPLPPPAPPPPAPSRDDA
jgi:nitrite reductase/ring-hydroxylating ferredoxin subunit